MGGDSFINCSFSSTITLCKKKFYIGLKYKIGDMYFTLTCISTCVLWTGKCIWLFRETYSYYFEMKTVYHYTDFPFQLLNAHSNTMLNICTVWVNWIYDWIRYSICDGKTKLNFTWSKFILFDMINTHPITFHPILRVRIDPQYPWLTVRGGWDRVKRSPVS